MSRLADNRDRLIKFLEHECPALGFSCFGITSPSAPELPARLTQFLQYNYHGSMGWMAETAQRRSDPKKLWPDVRSIIMIGMNYGPEFDPLEQLKHAECGAVSVYARNRDYHDVIKGRLKTLASKLLSRARDLGQNGTAKVFVDTAPVMEKPLAEQSGMGWQGKHTNLVSREHGSWLFLGSIFTTLQLDGNLPEQDHCGSCRSCLDVCPTHAFPAPYQLDARRCISYLTIENKQPIPVEFRKAIGNRVFGCDDCLAVCPWNKFAQQSEEVKLSSVGRHQPQDLNTLLQLSDHEFRKLYAGSPVKRIGRDRFIRNCLIAAGNSSRPELIPLAKSLVEDGSALVRGAAIWALSQLSPADLLPMMTLRIQETDESVLNEWALFNEGYP